MIGCLSASGGKRLGDLNLHQNSKHNLARCDWLKRLGDLNSSKTQQQPKGSCDWLKRLGDLNYG